MAVPVNKMIHPFCRAVALTMTLRTQPYFMNTVSLKLVLSPGLPGGELLKLFLTVWESANIGHQILKYMPPMAFSVTQL